MTPCLHLASDPSEPLPRYTPTSTAVDLRKSTRSVPFDVFFRTVLLLLFDRLPFNTTNISNGDNNSRVAYALCYWEGRGGLGWFWWCEWFWRWLRDGDRRAPNPSQVRVVRRLAAENAAITRPLTESIREQNSARAGGGSLSSGLR
jgi:hypothetical protein